MNPQHPTPAFMARPGTLAFRAIGYLETLPPGTELSSSALAEALGADGAALTACLGPAHEHGLIDKRKRGGHVRSPVFWSLPAGVRRANGDDEIDAAQAGPARDGSQKPDGGVRGCPAEAGSGIPEGRGSQHVLKAEAAGPDATDREIPATLSPGGGPRRIRQPAGAGPAGGAAVLSGRTATLSMTGEIAVVAECGTVVLFDAERARRLLAFLRGAGQ